NHKSAQDMTWAKDLEPDSTVIPANLGLTSVQIGTLGGGNHFIEVQTDEEGRVWLMVHSGSRGLGHKVCTHYDAIAKAQMLERNPDAGRHDLGYLTEGTAEHDEYLRAMNWCCAFAEENRERMLAAAVDTLGSAIGRDPVVETSIQTHHNYASLEEHGGE